MTRYEITEENGIFKLYSVVSTSWGGDARNYVATGTRDECEALKLRLEKPSASMMLRPREGV